MKSKSARNEIRPDTGLVAGEYQSKFQNMSTTELLEQVKALLVLEREKFLLAVLTLDEKSPPSARGKSRRVKWPDVEARARQIFGDRKLPNLVLLEREEAAR